MQSIQARAGEWLMFHAAGVSDDAGAVVALIGPSGTGKSTAARTLCRDDFGYVTDETVAVQPDGTIVPFPKPLAVIPAGGGVKLELGPDELGLGTCPPALRLSGLVLLERQEGLTAPAVERLGLLEGIVAMVSDMSALPHVPSALARVATLADQCGGLHRIVYGDAGQLSVLVRQVLEVGPVRSAIVQHPSCTVADRPGLVRAEHHDAIELDTEVLILQGSTCVLTRGIGALAWLAAVQPLSFDEVVEAVVGAAGDHPEAERLVRAAVDDLVAQGVLVSR
ncbi:hypothetical protein [Granulicoccus sp. GXG6511]|uniref:hypothetical protein n=1 Tax=Granulicoccus sp. GXG6511 TaxID=3381351 RepID=UPI003D7DB58F